MSLGSVRIAEQEFEPMSDLTVTGEIINWREEYFSFCEIVS